MSNSRTIALIILIIFFHYSCGQKKEVPPPYVIPKERLIFLLVDYHLAQGITNSYSFRERTKNIERINLCDSVIIAHGYTRAQFDSTLQYYSARVEEFDRIYERVVTELNRLQARTEEKKQSVADSSRVKPQ